MTPIRKGVITAAGRGTRQYPASKTVQKELFPLVDVDGFAKPTVQILAEELFASGLEEVCIVANASNIEPMRRHFLEPAPASFAGKDWADALTKSLADMADKLTFVVQETQDGYGHAVYQAREFAGSEPFLITLGDHVYLSHTEPAVCGSSRGRVPAVRRIGHVGQLCARSGAASVRHIDRAEAAGHASAGLRDSSAGGETDSRICTG